MINFYINEKFIGMVLFDQSALVQAIVWCLEA